APGGQEHFLDNFLGVAHVAEQTVRQTHRLAMVSVIQCFEVGQLGRSGAHDPTGPAKIGVVVGAWAPGGNSMVTATVVPRAPDGSVMRPSPTTIVPAATGCFPAGMIQAS